PGRARAGGDLLGDRAAARAAAPAPVPAHHRGRRARTGRRRAGARRRPCTLPGPGPSGNQDRLTLRSLDPRPVPAIRRPPMLDFLLFLAVLAPAPVLAIAVLAVRLRQAVRRGGTGPLATRTRAAWRGGTRRPVWPGLIAVGAGAGL